MPPLPSRMLCSCAVARSQAEDCIEGTTNRTRLEKHAWQKTEPWGENLAFFTFSVWPAGTWPWEACAMSFAISSLRACSARGVSALSGLRYGWESSLLSSAWRSQPLCCGAAEDSSLSGNWLAWGCEGRMLLRPNLMIIRLIVQELQLLSSNDRILSAGARKQAKGFEIVTESERSWKKKNGKHN